MALALLQPVQHVTGHFLGLQEVAPTFGEHLGLLRLDLHLGLILRRVGVGRVDDGDLNPVIEYLLSQTLTEPSHRELARTVCRVAKRWHEPDRRRDVADVPGLLRSQSR